MGASIGTHGRYVACRDVPAAKQGNKDRGEIPAIPATVGNKFGQGMEARTGIQIGKIILNKTKAILRIRENVCRFAHNRFTPGDNVRV